MGITTQMAGYLLSAILVLSIGCKKTEQSVKMGQVPIPDCEPIRVFSTAVDETYIVMLRDAGTQSGTVQTLGKTTTVVTAVFSRHSIPVNQQIAMLRYIHSGFVARLNRDQAAGIEAGPRSGNG